MENRKNTLYELIKDRGYRDDCLRYSKGLSEGSDLHEAVLRLKLGGKLYLVTDGQAATRVEAEMIAADRMLAIIDSDHRHLYINWEDVQKDAQLGDALIKLCAYATLEMDTAAEKSFWLQEVESDRNLARLFDKLRAQDHPDVRWFGSNLGQKRKATWIEALIWQSFGSRIIAASADEGFGQIRSFLS